MVLVIYDGTFEGFLSSVFEIYEYRYTDVIFSYDKNYQETIFGKVHEVNSEEKKFDRVIKGLQQKISQQAIKQLYRTFLSREKGIENILLEYIRYVFSSKLMPEHDYSHPAVLAVQQMSRKVYREKHRMEAFVRFQLTADQLYYAVVDPDFDVLPLIIKHFRDRYADQNWLIYDTRRKYGIYYNQSEVTYITMTFAEDIRSGNDITAIYDEKEELYQKLWQQYFSSVNISSRKNMKLHIQHMPKRYWKYLPEKH